ncbi:hypothetical protein, partial [Natronococcus sp.]|uniref:hypothetical protein n=1 Tax=Natronococcus sp. TaxID=35747 RepID=UPI003A4DDC96
MERPPALDGFADQHPLEHAATVVAALGVFWIGYFGAVVVGYGDVSILAVETHITAQRVGGMAGSILVWTFFGFAFVRGSGGPLLNAVVYPLAIVAFAPFVGRWALFGIDTGAVVSRFVGLFVLEPFFTLALAVDDQLEGGRLYASGGEHIAPRLLGSLVGGERKV